MFCNLAIVGILLVFLDIAIASEDYCPPLGPVLPPTRQPSQHASVQSVIANLSQSFTSLVASYNTTAVSVSLASIHEKAPLLSLHHTPSVLNSTGAKKIDSNTVYRIGSVTKVFTVLAVLLQDGLIGWTDPVTDYLPELAELATAQASSDNDISVVRWEEITVGALASQLSGIGRAFENDLSLQPFPWTELGFPALEESEIPTCGGTSGQPPCTKEELLESFAKRHPVYASQTTPVYSNTAFSILGLVIESATGRSFESISQDSVFEPLKMGRTSLTKPAKNSWGAIPVGDSWWETDQGAINPSGSIYTSTADLLAFGRAILESKLLSPAKTRAWLKQLTHTSSLGYSVGAPWEVRRSNTLTSDRRVIDIYTKSGGIGLYGSNFVLIPDYDLVLTVLVAGPASEAVSIMTLEVIKSIVPAIDKASKNEAAQQYSGFYESLNDQKKGTIALSVDDGPGLKIGNWTSNGADILQLYALLTTGADSGVQGEARLYPTNLQSGRSRAWRAVLSLRSPDPADQGDSPYIQSSCETWFGIDGYVYGYRAIDEFIVSLGDNARSDVEIESTGLRLMMERVSS